MNIVDLAKVAGLRAERAQKAMHAHLTAETYRAWCIEQQRFLRLCEREVTRA